MYLEKLQEYWQSLLNNSLHDSNDSIFRDLVAAYSQPHRYYHTLQHVYHVLQVVDQLQSYTHDLQAVQFAAWFHDVIYDPRSQHNEENSAEVAIRVLRSLHIPAQTVTKTAQLILCTKSHQPGDDPDAQVLMDADLAILGAERKLYWDYAIAIRQEYAWVPLPDYKIGRRQVLENFLQKTPLYSTPPMLAQSEPRVAGNLQSELQYLQR